MISGKTSDVKPTGTQWARVALRSRQDPGRKVPSPPSTWSRPCLTDVFCSSARNYLAYHRSVDPLLNFADSLIIIRGTRGSYQQWANAVEDSSFTFENWSPPFQKSPNFTAPNLSKLPAGENISYDATAFSEAGGPLHVSYSNYLQPMTPFINEAMSILGLGSIPGPNSGDLIGSTRMTSTIDPSDETRSSSETSFLRAAIVSSSLQIYKNTVATKILFDTSKKATGVQITTAGDSYVLSARKEVVLAAGTVSSRRHCWCESPRLFAYVQPVQIAATTDGLWDRTCGDSCTASDPSGIGIRGSRPKPLGARLPWNTTDWLN